MYATENSKIAFVCSLLTVKARNWATDIWHTNVSTFTTFENFLQRFREVFDHPEGEGNAGEELLTIQQGNQSASEFVLHFRTLSAQTEWLDDTLKTVPQNSQHWVTNWTGMSWWGEIIGSIHWAVYSLWWPFTSTKTSTCLFILSNTKHAVSTTYYEWNCFYCGQSAHVKPRFPVKPPIKTLPVSSTTITPFNNQSIEVPVTLYVNKTMIHTTAMINSGAAGNFMDCNFTCDNSIPLKSCDSTLAIMRIDRHTLGDGKVHCTTQAHSLRKGSLHCKTIDFFIINSHWHSVILGMPWLRDHNPIISWRWNGEIISWSEPRLKNCLQPVVRVHLNAITVQEGPTQAQNTPVAFANYPKHSTNKRLLNYLLIVGTTVQLSYYLVPWPLVFPFVLSQRQLRVSRQTSPMCLFSRKLNSAERNYDVGNRELLAMEAAMDEWRHWLEEAKHKFTVIPDHKHF